MNEHFFIYNGEFFRAGVPVITVESRSFRYGDGLFETMRLYKGEIINADFHFERLFAGMKLLEFEVPAYFSVNYFIETVNKLLSKNSILEHARIRLMVFRGEEGLFEIESNSINYVLETFPLPEKIELNEEGLVMDVFTDAAKSCDKFSNIKSSNYLPSIMAARFAKKNNLDDAIILNAFGRFCESSIANIFIVKDNKIFTPALSEGCVAGVMRRWMIENFAIQEKPLSLEELLSADELFLTNSIQLIKWVKQFRSKTYGNEKVKEIFENVVERLSKASR
jgi:branched-chain amino acid aminotransferase